MFNKMAKGMKKINDVVNQFQTLLDQLREGIDLLLTKEQENNDQISELEFENSSIQNKVSEADALIKSIESFKKGINV